MAKDRKYAADMSTSTTTSTNMMVYSEAPLAYWLVSCITRASKLVRIYAKCLSWRTSSAAVVCHFYQWLT